MKHDITSGLALFFEAEQANARTEGYEPTLASAMNSLDQMPQADLEDIIEDGVDPDDLADEIRELTEDFGEDYHLENFDE